MTVDQVASPAAAEPDEEVTNAFTVPGSWAFTPEVARVFDEHVEASVPFYREIQALVAGLSDWLAPAAAVVADLGASTGTTAWMISRRHPNRRLTFHLYDAERSMLDVAAERLAGSDTTVHYHHTRLESGLLHDQADLTLALFTLQFLDPIDRAAVLAAARQRSRARGALIVAEKLRLTDALWQEIAISSSHDYKAMQGISSEAIRVKERSLRGVLNPLTDAENRQLLVEAGWSSLETLFRWQQWTVYAAFARP
jgi:tRNA (cmo5U34)-methyltransferase